MEPKKIKELNNNISQLLKDTENFDKQLNEINIDIPENGIEISQGNSLLHNENLQTKILKSFGVDISHTPISKSEIQEIKSKKDIRNLKAENMEKPVEFHYCIFKFNLVGIKLSLNAIVKADPKTGKLEIQAAIGCGKELYPVFTYSTQSNFGKAISRGIIVVTNTLFEANKLYNTLSVLNNDTLLFPMDDFLTSQAISISPDLMISRLETINELVNNNKKIVVTHLMGALRYLPTKEEYSSNTFKLKVGDDYEINDLIEKLIK